MKYGKTGYRLSRRVDQEMAAKVRNTRIGCITED
jgi:hypothetical protein